MGRRLLHRLTEASRAPFQSALNRARVAGVWPALDVRMRAKTSALLEVCLRSGTFIGTPMEAILLHVDFGAAPEEAAAPSSVVGAPNLASGVRRLGGSEPPASSADG